jgi:DNA-binding response OmpR family regulator
VRVLLIEDDPMIGAALETALRAEGSAVDWVREGSAADTALMQDVYDLVLLDLGLPDRNGLDVLRRLRARQTEVPVMIVTARDEIEDRIAGLDCGADDYLIKPFDLDEMLARARALVRRRAGRGSPQITFGALVLDPTRRRVRFREQEVELSMREFAILEALAREPGVVLSRAKLEESVYGWGEEVGSNTIEVYLHHLRRKLDPKLIRNVRGVGYRLARVD